MNGNKLEDHSNVGPSSGGSKKKKCCRKATKLPSASNTLDETDILWKTS